MKRKVGELFNKPIVQGNENVLSPNEILVEQKGNTFSLKERVNGEIREVSGGNSGGGTELEGEYYLAKPNGRYWKTKFFRFERPNVPVFDISKVSEEQTEMVLFYLQIMSYCGYSVIGYKGGTPDSAWETTSFSPIESCERCSRLLGEMTVSQKLSFLIPAAFEECNFKIQEMDFEGVVGFMRMIMREEVDNMTDEEVLTLASEMFMIEPITKEEYDTWKYWNIN